MEEIVVPVSILDNEPGQVAEADAAATGAKPTAAKRELVASAAVFKVPKKQKQQRHPLAILAEKGVSPRMRVSAIPKAKAKASPLLRAKQSAAKLEKQIEADVSIMEQTRAIVSFA